MLKQRTNTHSGLTLVELLVVVVILVLLIGVALPLAQPALNGRDVREAARQVNAMIAGAKSQAATTGRPAGILIQPDDVTGERCYSISYAKVPPSYSGELPGMVAWRTNFDTADADALGNEDYLNMNPVTFTASEPLHEVLCQQFLSESCADLASGVELRDLFPRFHVIKLEFQDPDDAILPPVLSRLLSIGQDLTTDFVTPFEIRANNRGDWFRGLYIHFAGNAAISGFYVASPNANQLLNAFPAPGSPGSTYQITRPAKKSAASALELPVGSYIDLTVSGIPQLALLTPDGPPTGVPISITFNPDGSLRRMSGPFMADLTNPVFFLIANQKNNGRDNLQQDAGSLWVVIDPATGNVSTTENFVPSSDVADALADNGFNGLSAAEKEPVMNQLWAAALSGPAAGGR